MMPVAFEQDPEMPDGTGTFHFGDGSSQYAWEPELATQVRENAASQGVDVTAPGGPMLAQADPAAQALRSRLLQSGAPPPDPYAGINDAPGAPVAPEPAWFQAAQGAETPLPGKFAVTGQAPATPEPAPTPAPPRQGQTVVEPAGPRTAPPPRRWIPGQAGGAVPTAMTVEQEREGAPYDPEMARMRVDAANAVTRAGLNEFKAHELNAQAQAEAAQRAAIENRYEAAKAKTNWEKLDQNYKVERAKLNTEINEFDKNAKIDPGRLFHEAGTFGTIAMVIGQALGAYAAILGKSDNFAQKMIQDALDNDIAAQRANIESGRIANNNKLAQLAQQYGDIGQAETAYRLIADKAIDNQIRAMAKGAESQDAQMAAEKWLAQRNEQTLLNEQKFMDQSIGKVRTSTNARVVQPTAGRYESDDDLMDRTAKSNERKTHLLKSENELAYEQGGGKHAEDAGKSGGTVNIEGIGEVPKNREMAVRAAIADRDRELADLDEQEHLNNSWKAKVPFGLTDDAARAGVVREKARTAKAKSYGGIITESDREAAGHEVADATSLRSGTQQIKIEEERRVVEHNFRQALKKAIDGRPNIPRKRDERDEEPEETEE